MKNYALITGASGGIGFDLAKLLAKDKHNLVLIARSEDKLKEIKSSFEKDHGINILIITVDLSVPESASKVFDELEKQDIHIDILINNAGFGDFGIFAECDWQKQEQMINLNILALTKLTRLFLPAMIKLGNGRIMNVASTAAFQPGPLMSVYYATKAFVLSFTYAIANEIKGTGVKITALCPGPTDTGFVSAASLEGSKLFKTFKPKTSSDVALFGYKRMMKGKLLAIPGAMNKLMVWSIRFTPRKLITFVVRAIQEKDKSR
jgi:short-subunit dehydrogenase